MAVKFMPESFFSSVKFDLHRYMSQNMLKGGRTQTMEQAEPRWTADFTTGRLDEARRRQWAGFWASLRGGLNSFVAFDPSQDYPYAYAAGFAFYPRAGGGSFVNGQAGVTGIAPDQIAIGGGAAGLLPPSFTLIPGDKFGLVQGDKYGLYVVTDYFTATSGGAMTISSFEPRILTNIFTVAAVAYFYRPGCMMIPDPNSWDMTVNAVEPPSSSFSGIQKLF